MRLRPDLVTPAVATAPPTATSATTSAAFTDPTPPGVGTGATATVAARYRVEGTRWNGAPAGGC